MLTFFNGEGFRQEELNRSNDLTLADAIWIDMLNPSPQELENLKEYFGFKIPTRAEMIEIEISSRLYTENNNLFMTGTMISNSTSTEPKLDPITFILTKKQLITIRYIEPQAFKLFVSQVGKLNLKYDDPLALLIDLLDATIDRSADILEYIGQKIDSYSKKIFNPNTSDVDDNRDYRQLLQEVAAYGDLNTKAQESLMTFNRLTAFLIQSTGIWVDKEYKTRLANLRKDIISLSQHTHFLSNKVSFLLDATLGLVNIAQNNIIKIFSVAAVIFLPPTLIASIYGMNFKFIPEINWKYGYLLAVGLMMFFAWAPYKYFKWKKWL